jgi:uncharacterized membrane protein
MVNLKLGGMLLVAGSALFLLSDTVFGESEAASYSMFLGLILFLLGFVLCFVGIIKLLIARVKDSARKE